MDSKLPRTIGPYRLEKRLGRGGMGELYHAYDTRLHRQVAMKQVRRDVDRPAANERLRREARAAARLSSPSVVPVFDLLESDDGDWIVMELIEGPSLAELMARGPLAISRAVTWGRQIAEGLVEAHAKGVLHRDLKAENVMIAPSGQARILDFGLAKPLPRRDEDLREWGETLSSTGAVLGTARAMAPEQVQGLELTDRADLFSLGVLLYEMLAGQSPFQGPTVYETLKRVVSEPHPPVTSYRPETPPALAKLVDRLLEKAPELRPSGAAEVVAELAAVEEPAKSATASTGTGLTSTLFEEEEGVLPRLEAGRTSATRGPAPGTARRLAGRRRLLTATAVLLAVALAVAGTRLWLRRGAEPAAVGSPPPAEALAPEEAVALYRQGMELLRRYDVKGHVDLAIAKLQRALTADPESAAAHAGLARAYLYKLSEVERDPLRLEQALAVARRAVALDDHLAAAHTSLGLVYVEEGRYEEAQKELEWARTLDPSDVDALRGLGQIHAWRGDVDAAEKVYRDALAIDGENRQLLDNLGTLDYRRGNWASAAEWFQRSIDVAPDGIYGHRNLASALFMMGRTDDAVAELQKAIAVRPDPSLYTNLGTLLYYQGLYPQAATAFEKALETGGTGSNTPIAWANLGDACRLLPGREDDARKAFRQAVRLLLPEVTAHPENTRLKSRLVLYYAKLGERGEATKELAAVDLAGEKDPSTLYRVALACEILGDRDRAMTVLEQAVAAGYPLSEVKRDPELIDLRADVRFHDLLDGLADGTGP